MRRKKRGLLIIGGLACAATSIGISSSVATRKPPFKSNKDSLASIPERSIADQLYTELQLAEKGLSPEAFSMAVKGYRQLLQQGRLKNPILTIADMSQPSAQNRLYLIDMQHKVLLKNTLVAHGRNSGEKMATIFSNKPSSLQSSLGFFITGETYQGDNGYSLRLHGMEKGFNDNALDRAIVMHGAAYVNELIAKQTGRIGRSWGCPAVSMKEHKEIIDRIKEGSCLFIYAPQKGYLAHSKLISETDTAHLPGEWSL